MYLYIFIYIIHYNSTLYIAFAEVDFSQIGHSVTQGHSRSLKATQPWLALSGRLALSGLEWPWVANWPWVALSGRLALSGLEWPIGFEWPWVTLSDLEWPWVADWLWVTLSGFEWPIGFEWPWVADWLWVALSGRLALSSLEWPDSERKVKISKRES